LLHVAVIYDKYICQLATVNSF